MWYAFELFRVDAADGLTLAVGSSAEHVDDFLFASAEPFHGSSEDVGVAHWYEKTRCHYSCHFLQSTPPPKKNPQNST